MQSNRDDFQSFLSIPTESTEDALKRIYAAQRSNKNRANSTDIVDDVKKKVFDGIDLYVVLPPLNGSVYIADSGKTMECRQ